MTFIVDILIRTTVVLLAGAAIAALLRRASSSARHTVRALTMISALLVPLLTWVLPALDVPVYEGTPSGDIPASPAVFNDTLSPMDTSWTVVDRPNRKEETVNWSGIAWGLGFFVGLAQMLFGMFGVRRLARQAQPVGSERWNEMLAELLRSLSIRRPVRMLISQGPITPMTWGFRKSVILLPAGASEWPEERLRHVLAHELAHVKRNDGILQIVIHVICSVYWFNPAVWFAARRLRIERERACDDNVLNLGARPDEYAEDLLEVARAARPAMGLSFATVSMAHGSQLETRLLGILDARAKRRKLTRFATVFLVLAISALTVPAASLRVTAESVEPQTTPPETSVRERYLQERIDELSRQVTELLSRLELGEVTRQVQEAVPEHLNEEVRRAMEEAETALHRDFSKQQEAAVEAFRELERAQASGELKRLMEETHALSQSYGDTLQWSKPKHLSFTGTTSPDQVEKVIQPLLDALKDDSEDVRTEAIDAIRHLGLVRDSRVFDPLIAAMKDSSEDVRSAAALALGSLGDPRAIVVLTAALKDQSADVRRSAVRALAQIARR